jgi:hypothetical protein
MATNIENRIKYIKKILDADNLAGVGYPVFLKNTPIKTGNARNHTTKGIGEIEANYPYARRLDRGYSRQSPAGMTQPTITAIREYIKKTLGV